MLRQNAALPLVLFAATVASPASAQLTTFSTRDAFTAAAGATVVETFDDITTDTSFRMNAVSFKDFSVLGSGRGQSDRNFFDVSPPLFASLSVNGTTFLNGLVATVNGGSSFTINFNRTIFSFGFDFAGLQDDELRTAISFGGQSVTPPVQQAPGFFGVVSATGFNTVTFSSLGANDGFGLDDLTFGTTAAAVPEPTSWAMMIAGFAAVGGMTRRRRGGALRTA